MVREATQRRCKCHGISGMCLIRSCWDQPLNFGTITSRLRSIYLLNTTLVDLRNLGSYTKPDLYLSRVKEKKNYNPHKSGEDFSDLFTLIPKPSHDSSTIIDPVRPKELIHLQNSPDYCDPQPLLEHFGTRGRPCLQEDNLTLANGVSNKNVDLTINPDESDVRHQSPDGTPGSCQFLCCNRGYFSELVLDLVDCNCRFKFCCRVDCDYCLRQRLQHYCR